MSLMAAESAISSSVWSPNEAVCAGGRLVWRKRSFCLTVCVTLIQMWAQASIMLFIKDELLSRNMSLLQIFEFRKSQVYDLIKYLQLYKVVNVRLYKLEHAMCFLFVFISAVPLYLYSSVYLQRLCLMSHPHSV